MAGRRTASRVRSSSPRRSRSRSSSNRRQRAALLEGFRQALSLPMCAALRLGVSDLSLRLGPLVVSVEGFVLLLAVLTDSSGGYRFFDTLPPGELPHLTVGRARAGGGVIRPVDGRRVLYSVAHAPRPVPGLATLEWSREERFVVDMSSLVEDISSSPLLGSASRRGLSVSGHFDFDENRFVLVGGEALRTYRAVQARVAARFADADYAFELWSSSDDVSAFRAHVSLGYE